MTKEKHTTFRIDSDIKEAFKKEIELAGMDMTEAIESFMISYVNIKRKERREKVK
jgi:antitoxin component of RelBE/YafQ-DinJ toxin-antitoxin module